MITKPAFSKTLYAAFFATAMLFGSSTTFAQVKIGTNPTSINAANNLEVEASTTGRKTSIDKTTGQVTIKDGTEGDLRILMSDPVGAASWKELKTTSIFSFGQSAGSGVVINLPVGGAVCGTLACATYLNWTGSFTTLKSINDVVIDATGNYNLAFSTTTVQFNLFLAIDKTTPGVFETIGSFFVTQAGLACAGDYMNYKTVLQNLPPRTYTVRVYAAPWTNYGAVAKLGIGAPSNPGSCGGPAGSDLTNSQKLIVSVSQ